MKKAFLLAGIFVVFLSATSFGLFAQQADLMQMSRDFKAKSDADRALAYRLAEQNGWPVRGTGQDGSFFELQKMLYGMPAYYTTLNANAAISTRADSVNMVIGGGTGFVLREWDAGAARTTHQELTGRVTWADPSAYVTHYHSTHVAGTLIASGVQAAAKGMSYAASLRSFEWTNDYGEMSSEASAGMNLSNHSYAYTRGWYVTTPYSYWYGDTAISETRDYSFGFYDEEAVAVDQIANAAPNYLIVAAAANDRDDAVAPGTKHYYWDSRYSAWRFSTKWREADGASGGYDCIPNGMQLAKNTLTVGAVYDVLSYTGPSSVAMLPFSSWGPTDDGRIKPDVVANGYALYSSTNTGDANYATYSGTSMASPNACGSLGLLEDYYRDTHAGTPMRAATLKALAINTALEAGSNTGPDYAFGWGLLNVQAGYKLLNKDYLNDAKGYIEQLTLNQGQTLEYWYRVFPSTPELRVTICWNDPPGTPPSPSVNPRTRMLVNDLDLRAVKGATTHYPWHLDVENPSNAPTQADNNIDNVEQVGITSPAAGVYAIRITHKGTLSGGSQNFSLIVSGAERNHVWHVYANGSGDAPTIASAVSYAVDGDSIYVHGGVFNEHDISVNKQLVIKGVADAGSPIVDAQSSGRCFYFPSASKVIKLDGLTLRNGMAPTAGLAYHGGAILCQNSSVTITNCTIHGSNASAGGGGISVSSANPVIRRCVLYSNSTGGGGGGGGAIEASSANVVVDSCVIYENTSALNGGGAWLSSSSPSFLHTTVTHNSAAHGGGIYVGPSGNPTLTNVIISFGGGGGGIYGDPLATGATITCCDVYGNVDGNYGGTITDRTGINNNISKDPMYCSVATDVYTISSLSSCAPARSPCGQLIGALPVGCAIGPDLVVAEVQFTSMQPAFGDSVRATVKVKNIGQFAAMGSFYIDYYQDLASPPAAGTPGDQRFLAAGLAAGDSVTWVTAWAKETVFEEWTSYFRVDTGDSILETNEGNNLSGPHAIMWQIPIETGWPVAVGYGFHSSPAIASIDTAETNLEIVIGCDDGKLYVLKRDGSNAGGWPVTIGDTLFSSPAVADITGDYHREIVIGAKDGKIYAYDFVGVKLWEYATGSPIYRTPVLVDLDKDGKCEVLCSSGNALYALEGDGTAFAGSWPYTVGAGTLTSPAAGDVDGDGTLEIAAIAYGYTVPVESRVYLLEANGTLASGSWPAIVDTVIVADPVLGNVISPDTDLEIVAGATNGRVYVWDVGGTVWLTPPRATGAIETSPMLMQVDVDAELEIVVSSRLFVASPPPGHWEGLVTMLDNTGSVISGWPTNAGTWTNDVGPQPSPISIGGAVEVMVGSASRSYYSWDPLGGPVYGFPVNLEGDILTSAAADDIDGDGRIELVVASGSPAGSIHCYELYQPNYATSNLWWPMFRHDRARTGCYGSRVPTAVETPREATPSATCIRSIYPNPFNPMTRIVFDVSTAARVELSIYDVSGRRVATLVDRDLGAGKHEIVWNGRTGEGTVASSGIYFCKLTAGSLVETKKIVLLR